MPTKKKSAKSSPRSKPNRSAVGPRIAAGLREALAHARSKAAPAEYTVTVPQRIDVAAMRRALEPKA